MKLKNAIRHSKVLAYGTKIFPLGGVQRGTGPLNVDLGSPKISEITRAGMLKLKTIRYCELLALGKNISPLGASKGRRAP